MYLIKTPWIGFLRISIWSTCARLLPHLISARTRMCHTRWRRLTGCLKLQVIFRKRAINYRALLQEMTYKDKASYGFSPPCIAYNIYVSVYVYIYASCHTYVSMVISLSISSRAPDRMWKRTATHCNTLPHTATFCHALPHTATHCHTLQHTCSANSAFCRICKCTATHCNTWQHTATFCNTLQHTATHGNTLQDTCSANSVFNKICKHTATHCNTKQHTITQCNITAQPTACSTESVNALQHTTTYCNTLQRTPTRCNTLLHAATHLPSQQRVHKSL